MTIYRVGYRGEDKYHYIVCESKAEAMAEVADKLCIAEDVRVRKIERFSLGEEK